jgi:hypothetical protein
LLKPQRYKIEFRPNPCINNKYYYVYIGKMNAQGQNEEQFTKVLEAVVRKENKLQTEEHNRNDSARLQEVIFQLASLHSAIENLSKIVGGGGKKSSGKKNPSGDAAAEGGDAKPADADAKPAEGGAKPAKPKTINTKTLFKEKFAKDVEFRDKVYTAEMKTEFDNHAEVAKRKSANAKLSAVAELVYDRIKTREPERWDQLIKEITTDGSTNTVGAEPPSP